jgi:hypothetical protein
MKSRLSLILELTGKEARWLREILNRTDRANIETVAAQQNIHADDLEDGIRKLMGELLIPARR